MRSAFRITFPPNDLYRTLMMVPLDVRQSDFSIDGELTHPYAGKYEIGLQVAKCISMTSSKCKSNVRLLVELSSPTGAELEALIGNTIRPWWGRDVSGFSLFHYWVPSNLPVDTKIQCRVRVETPSDEFFDMYGDAALYVRKSSEK